MKLKDSFVTREMAGGQVMVGVGSSAFSGVVRSNRTAAFIVDQLKSSTTKEAIVEAMLEKYEVARPQAEADVDRIIGVLRSINALED